MSYSKPTDSSDGLNFDDGPESQIPIHTKEKLMGMASAAVKLCGWELDLASGRSAWTDELANIFDMDHDNEITPDITLSFCTPRSRLAVEQAYRDAIDHGKPYDIEIEIISAKHRRKWLRTIVAPIKENEKVVKLQGILQDVTDRVNSELAFRKSEQRLNKAQAVAHVGNWELDLQTKVLWGSIEAAKIYGLSAMDNLLPLNIVQACVLAEDRYMMDRALELLVEEGTEYDVEYRIIRSNDGAVRYVHSVAECTRDSEGNPLTIVGVVQDITNRKLITDALRNSEARHRVVFEGAVEGILLYNETTYVFEYANPAMCRMFGYTQDEFKDLKVDNIHPEDSIAMVREEFEAIVRGDKARAVEIPCKRKNGTRFYADITASHTFIKREPIVVAFFNDITERRRNDCILKARLRLGNLPPEVSCDDMLQMILDEAERVTDSKIGFYHDLEEDGITLRLQNWSTNTLTNMCTAEGKGSHYPVDEAGIWAEAVRQGVPVICNDYANALNKRGIPEGHAPVTRFVSVPIRYNDRIVSIIGVGNKPEDYDQLDVDAVLVLANETLNVIQRKRAEDRLVSFNEELEHRVEERTSQLVAAINEQEAFAYTISHDLRAPLRAINGYTSIIEDKYNDRLDVEGWRLLNVVKSEALRMGILIDDLLTFSRLNRAQLVCNHTDMNQLVLKVIQDLTPPRLEKHTDFRIGSLHPADADGNLIRQVWFNLISNAQKFTSKRENPVIEVGSCLEKNEVQYYVRDNGSGFNMQYVDKIFGVFQRLHDDSEYPGTGVGLAIVERIVQRHGGRVWAEGVPDKGATFWFTLPAGSRET